MPRVGVQFEIDANGILHVLARDTKTGKQKIVEMKSAVDVDDAAVQQMVEESVEHAFEDLAARRWIEATLRARETLAATRKGLADCGGGIGRGIGGHRIETAAAGGGKPPWRRKSRKPKPATPKNFRPPLRALDEATKPLAELLMDKAMEAMLRKRGVD